MLGRTLKISLAANRAIVLSRWFLQVNAEPSALCNMDRADISDNACPMSVGLNPLADFELRHGEVTAARRSCVLTAASSCVVELQGDASELREHGAFSHRLARAKPQGPT